MRMLFSFLLINNKLTFLPMMYKNFKFRIRWMVTSFLLLWINYFVTGADLVSVQPVTGSILMLKLDEGHVDYYGENQTSWRGLDNVFYFSDWDSTLTMNASSYLITSPDDAGWGNVVPGEVGRKSCPDELFGRDVEVEYVMAHYIFLKLPKSMVSGKTYTVRVGNIADNLNEYTFTFNEKVLRSETVHVNQIGFAQNQSKIAYLSLYMGDLGGLELNAWDGKPFNIVRFSDKQVVYSGTINFRSEKDVAIYDNATIWGPYLNATHADVAQCDFTSFSTPGEYVVSVPEMGCSFPFEINNDIYSKVFYNTMKGLFYQRASIVKELPDGRIYPRDHHPNDFPHYYNNALVVGGHTEVVDLFKTNTYPLDKPVTGIWGWYHDASDWDMYITHYKIPIALMVTYLMLPEKFYDGEIGNRYKLSENDPDWIDEGTNGIPDILDEAAWLAQFGKRARYALMDQGYGTGGCPGYIGREGGNFIDGMKPSWKDDREWAITAENPAFTMAYAAVAALYAECLNTFYQQTHPGQNHPEFQAWMDEAEQAYSWAQNHGGMTSGETSFQTIAGIILHKETGVQSYYTEAIAAHDIDSKKNYHIEAADMPVYGLSNVFVSLWKDNLSLDPVFEQACIDHIIGWTDYVAARTSASPYRYGSYGTGDFGLGKFGNPKVIAPMCAYVTTGNASYKELVDHNMAYVLGGNEMNTVYNSLLGERQQNKAIHHMDAWILNDYKSMVYSWDPLPGISTYWGDDGTWVSGIGGHLWTLSYLYPDWRTSPKAEQNVVSRESINGSEYTTIQTMTSWVITSAYLKGIYGTPQSQNQHNAVPTVELDMSDGYVLPENFQLQVKNASTDVRRVEYYYDWHFIGESDNKTSNFAFDWDISQTNIQALQEVLLTAVAYDDQGLRSVPSDVADKVAKKAPSNNYILCSTNEVIIPQTGGSHTINVFSDQSWTITVDQPWLSISPSAGLNDGSFVLSAPAYTNIIPNREGNVIVSGSGAADTIRVIVKRPIEPFARWTFDGNSNDVVGNADGVNEGLIAYETDVKQGTHSLYLDGIDAKVNLSNVDAGFPSGNNPLTFAAWVKISTNSNGHDVIFNYGTSSSNQNFYLKNLFGDLQVGSETDYIVLTKFFTEGEWAHLTVSYNGTELQVYKNGLLVLESPKTFNIVLNGAFIGATLTSSGELTGWIDDAMLFNYVLSDDEIFELFSVGVSDPGTIIHVTSVSLDIPSLSLNEGETGILTATVLPDEATDKSVVWSSSDNSVVTVNNGAVTAVAVGNAIITVTTNDGNKIAECSVVVNEVQNVDVTAGLIGHYKFDESTGVSAIDEIPTADFADLIFSGLANENRTTPFVAGYKGNAAEFDGINDNLPLAGTAITSIVTARTVSMWINPAILTGSRMLYEEGAGTGFALRLNGNQLEAKVASGSSYTAVATINSGWHQVAMSFEGNVALRLYIDGTLVDSVSVSISQVNAHYDPAGIGYTNIKNCFNTTGDFYAGLIDDVRIYNRALAASEMSILAGGTTVVPVQSISLNTGSMNLNSGETDTLVATISPSNASNQNVSWVTSNVDIASVSAGVVTAASINQTQNPTIMNLSAVSTTVLEGGTTTLTASGSLDIASTATASALVSAITDDGGKTAAATVNVSYTVFSTQPITNADVTFSSSNSSVATVDAAGTVTAVGEGNAIITAEANDGTQASVGIEVTVIHVQGVTLDQNNLTLYEGQSATLTATVTPSDAKDISVIWSSSDNSIATVSNGIVDAVAEGMIMVTVTTNDGGFKDSCMVTVNSLFQADTLSGLVAWYKMDGTTGTSIFNEVVSTQYPNLNFAGLVNESRTNPFVPGVNAEAVYFDGVNDRIPTSGSGFTNSFVEKTITMWIRPDATTGNYTLFEEGAGTGWALAIENSALKGVAKSVTEFNVSGTLSGTNWMFVALTFKGNENLSLYLDGVLIDQVLVNIPSIGTHTDGGGIGYTQNKNTFGATSTGLYYKGLIDEVKIYERALGIVDILAMYQSFSQKTQRIEMAQELGSKDGVGISIYPNPVSNHQLNLDASEMLAEVQMCLYDNTGKLAYSVELNSNKNIVNLPENLQNGIYYVKVLGKGYSISKKIILD